MHKLVHAPLLCLCCRCDGDYHFHIDKLLQASQKRYYLAGLNGDQVSYAAQASRRVRLTNKQTRTEIFAEILSYNYAHTEEKLYLGLDEDSRFLTSQQKSLERIEVSVKFELKHQYFDRLCDSVNKIPPQIVDRIVPDGFLSKVNLATNESHSLDLYQKDLGLDLCSDDQADALKAMPITSCAKGEPPFLLTGPFGSGKTRLLAIAAHISFRSCGAMKLLVCVQQNVSANAFLACFNEIDEARDVYVVQVVTETRFSKMPSSKYRKTVAQLQQIIQKGVLNNKKKVIIIATCSTANNLMYKKVFQSDFFTHIYIDEGAQMREPEAIAPLGFATDETILVIAGDQHQVSQIDACMCIVLFYS